MAKYLGTDGKIHKVALNNYIWSIITKEEWDYDVDYDEILEQNIVAIRLNTEILDNVLQDVNPIYPDGNEFVELYFTYDDSDILRFSPRAVKIAYPINDEDWGYREVELTDSEKKMFSKLLQEAIGDKHTPEMQKVMLNYEHSVDLDIYKFVRDVMENREVIPITVGFVSEKMDAEISALTGISTIGNRIVLSSDDVRHIIKRHGANGKADHSMEDIKDIARLSYVLANYDSIEWDGGVSNHYKTKSGEKAPQITIKKRVDGIYYVIQVASDSSKNRNVIITAYLTKATK